jgi:hypothetical protein
VITLATVVLLLHVLVVKSQRQPPVHAPAEVCAAQVPTVAIGAAVYPEPPLVAVTFDTPVFASVALGAPFADPVGATNGFTVTVGATYPMPPWTTVADTGIVIADRKTAP